jgi:hypothetical protein
MNDIDVLFFAVGSKNAAMLSNICSQCTTDAIIFIEKFCQFIRAESAFSALMG